MKPHLVLITLANAFTLLSLHGAMADRILARSGFDAGLEGWTASQQSEIAWTAKGGHPGGRVVFTQTLGGPNIYLIAPSAFLSSHVNYKRLDGKGYISWQHELIDLKSISTVYNYEMRMSGPGGAATFQGGLPPLSFNKWRTVAAPLNEANWVVTSGTWRGLLTDVESIQIIIELIGSGQGYVDVEAIDDIEVVYHPQGFSPK